jgi:hypothetical protein
MWKGQAFKGLRRNQSLPEALRLALSMVVRTLFKNSSAGILL